MDAWAGVGYLIDDCYLLHQPGPRHPEAPARLEAIRKALEEADACARLERVPARPATHDELELIHRPGLIERVERAARKAPTYLDSDTVVSEHSYHAALMAAGGVLECVDAILAGRLTRAFAFVRPPGHHAERDRSMGFCLFNNVALAAAYARRAHGLERVAVVDIDVHHGNGTQDIYYLDPGVLFVSSHQYPFYPGSGGFDEIGAEEGKGYTVNLALPEGTGDDTWAPLYSRIVGPILEAYRPELVLVSAGFDAYYRDPLGGLRMTARGYASVADTLIRAADATAGGRTCFVLEGGYSDAGLQVCTRAVLEQLELRARPPVSPNGVETPLYYEISEAARAAFGQVWKW